MIKHRKTETNSVLWGKVIGLSKIPVAKLTDAPFQLINALFQLTDAQNHCFYVRKFVKEKRGRRKAAIFEIC
jgi:hypothetical protein